MGMEVKEGCTDRERDGVIAYSNCTSPVLSSGTAPIHPDDTNSLELPKEVPLPDKYDVKQRNSLNISEACQARNAEEQSCPRIKVSNGHMQEKTKALSPKIDRETKGKVSPKSALKTCSTNGRTNCTIPQPFSLATEKRALIRPLETVTVMNKSSSKSKTTPKSPNFGKKYQQNMTMKPVKSENKKHSDEESSSSVASDISSPVRASKSKTVVSAPIFRSMERAEKRKEFNSKLEEKQQTLEAEKLQSEVRTKEEIEAAIKQLRRSMMFKASPLPSFYHEDSSSKHEGRKVIPTHGLSPKLVRRKSCSNAVGLSKKRTSKANRQSLGFLKEGPNNSSDTNSGSSSDNARTGLTYEDNEELERGRKREPIDRERLSPMNGQNNMEISVMS